jgi:TRAP-type uncharacterized transport system substrate-binding protein
MKDLLNLTTAIALFFAAEAFAGISRAAPPSSEADLHHGPVLLETEGSTGISVRMAEELTEVINDGATRRILPVIGIGSLQNIIDLKFLPSIDSAIVQNDVLDHAKQQNLLPGIESWLTYVTTLYSEEFHLVARSDIKTISDLTTRKVNVDVRGAGTATTATLLFNRLGIPVNTVNDDPTVAIEKLRRGEIGAVALVAGKPAPLFCDLIGENRLHFLSIPVDQAAKSGYSAARLTAADYPGLIPYNQPVDTVTVGTVLVVADLQAGSERYRNAAYFVDAFFSRFQSLLQPGRHPKWHEVDIARELPGWRRFPPAVQWLQRNVQGTAVRDIERLKADFERFIEEHQHMNTGSPLSQQEKDQLFEQFNRWRSEHPGLLRNPQTR